MAGHIFCMLVLFLFSQAFFLQEAQAETPVSDVLDRPWSVTVLHGIYTAKSFGNTVSSWLGETDNDYLAALALSRRIGRWGRHLTWEVEGLIASHFGQAGSYSYSYEELTACIVLRYHTFPWNRYVRTSVAMGEGISYTTQVPYREEQKADDSHQRFMNYLMAEATFSLPALPALSLVYRIHHRSGIYGLIGYQDSNYYCFGLRAAF